MSKVQWLEKKEKGRANFLVNGFIPTLHIWAVTPVLSSRPDPLSSDLVLRALLSRHVCVSIYQGPTLCWSWTRCALCLWKQPCRVAVWDAWEGLVLSRKLEAFSLVHLAPFLIPSLLSLPSTPHPPWNLICKLFEANPDLTCLSTLKWAPPPWSLLSLNKN